MAASGKLRAVLFALLSSLIGLVVGLLALEIVLRVRFYRDSRYDLWGFIT